MGCSMEEEISCYQLCQQTDASDNCTTQTVNGSSADQTGRSQFLSTMKKT